MVFYFIAFIVLLVETAKHRYLDYGGFEYYHPYVSYNYDAYLAAGVSKIID